MKYRILSLFTLLLFTVGAIAQDDRAEKDPIAFTSLSNAATLSKEIVKLSGQKANFMIAEAAVPNAMAVVHMGKRYVFYNPRFIQDLTRLTGSKWAAVSVLAHEIGHHLGEKQIGANGQKKLLATELEADEFSGYILKKMGASLEEAQLAMNYLATAYATRTHPGRDDRISSIAEGWIEAGGVISREAPIAKETRSTTQAGPGDDMLARIRFDAAPGTDYYLTRDLTMVKKNGAGLEWVGRLGKTNDPDFPFMITDDSSFRIYIGSDGRVVNRTGKTLGRVLV